MCPYWYGAWILMHWDYLPPLLSDISRMYSVGTIPIAINIEILGPCPFCLRVYQNPYFVSCVGWCACLNTSVLRECQIQLAYFWSLIPWIIQTETPTTLVEFSPKYCCGSPQSWWTQYTVIALAQYKHIMGFYLLMAPPSPMSPL